jgi:uncharacterized surface protein with fasciclin (FAS1) repeats
MKTKKIFALLAVFGVITTSTFAIERNKGIEIIPNFDTEIENPGTIVGVAGSNKDFSTLVAAVTAADLVATLNSEGPFTVFAPTNEAFSNLTAGTLDSLLKSENKETLQAILTYHVVAGKFKASDVLKAIQENNGKFEITTVQGGKLIASLNGSNVILTDEKGNISTIVITDVEASNGIIHAIDTVLLP